MFEDKFIGGPLDGVARPVDGQTLEGEPVQDNQTGTRYERAPHLDTATYRAWVPATTEVISKPNPEAVSPNFQVVTKNKQGITLADLRRFLDEAESKGHPAEKRVKVWAKFNGHMREIRAD